MALVLHIAVEEADHEDLDVVVTDTASDQLVLVVVSSEAEAVTALDRHTVALALDDTHWTFLHRSTYFQEVIAWDIRSVACAGVVAAASHPASVEMSSFACGLESLEKEEAQTRS